MADEPSSEFARALAEVGWTPRELAARLGVTESTTRSWATGRRTPHETVVEWLREIARRINEAPRYPAGWSRSAEPC